MAKSIGKISEALAAVGLGMMVLCLGLGISYHIAGYGWSFIDLYPYVLSGWIMIVSGWCCILSASLCADECGLCKGDGMRETNILPTLPERPTEEKK